MPNICYNIITFEDSQNDQNAMEGIKSIYKNKIDPQKLRPCPYLNEKDKQTDENTIRDWMIDNWGSNKFFLDDVDMELKENNLKITLETGWEPPLALCEYLSVQYPKLDIIIKYWESGYENYGEMVYYNGYSCESDFPDYAEFVKEFFDPDFENDESDNSSDDEV
jgi:hypothetical protein